jgi:alcohol dehydrogenase
VSFGRGRRVARALVLEGPRRLVARQFPVPDVTDTTAILRVEACGLCGSDHELYTGVVSLPFAHIPGHEVVGTIEEIGPRAAERWGVGAGDRVALEVFRSCEACDRCRGGDHDHCANPRGATNVDEGHGLWGGYVSHVYLPAGSRLHRVPDNLDPVVATLFNPVGNALRWAVSLPDTQPGWVVAILGAGIRGLAAAAAARDAGAAFVLVTGCGARDHSRLELAKAFGADATVDVDQRDPVQVLERSAGRLADLVVDVTANAPQAFVQAIELAGLGGTIVVAGMRGDVDVTGFRPDELVWKELRILGVKGTDGPSYRGALELLATHRHPFAQLPREVVGLSGAESLLQKMAGETGAVPPVHAVIAP